jgi:outer membrane protein OmpA-like peptidoglycan-associated protein
MRRHDQEARSTAAEPQHRSAAPAPRSAPTLSWIRIVRWLRAPIAAAALLGAIVGGTASAEPATPLRPGHRVQLAASAAELPALSALLERAGWSPTPELSGAFQPGRIFSADQHRLQVDDCFDTPIQRSTYTSAEVVTHLQAGVSVGMGLAQGHGELVKKLRFGAPEHLAMPALKMRPTEACLRTLREGAARGLDLSTLYVVQEALLAEIAEQTCGRLDARGRIVGLGAGEAALSIACAQESLEPVAVAFRVQPLHTLPGLMDALGEPGGFTQTAWRPTEPIEPIEPIEARWIDPDPAPIPPTGPLLSVRFAPGSTQLDAASLHTLRQLAEGLLREGAPALRVEAHTDNKGEGEAGGAPIANLSLSQARAEAVKAALVEFGVPAARLVARGYGSTAPIASNQTEAGRAANRRTEVWQAR